MHNPQAYLKNKLNSREEIAQAKIVLGSLPRRLMVVLTVKCNLDCIMCERRASNAALSKEAAGQISKFFPYLDSIMWQGGEVFLVDYFKELFQQASGYPDLIQEINTNGLLITPAWAEEFARANVRLILSIDSTDKKIYEYIRRGANFEALIKNLTLLKEAQNKHAKSATHIINVVVMRSNYQGLEDFADFAAEYGFGGINLLYMVGKKCPQENIFEPADARAIAYLQQSVPRLMGKCKRSGINVSCEFKVHLGPVEPPQDSLPAAGGKELFCAMPWKSLFIDGAQGGKVYPECVCLRPAGELSKNSLAEIWNGQTMQMYRKKVSCGDLENWCNPKCINGSVNRDFLRQL